MAKDQFSFDIVSQVSMPEVANAVDQTRREIPLKSLHFGPPQPAAKGTSKQTVNVKTGISEDKARELTKFVKGLKVKVQTQVQGDQVRVSGKTKDDLQAVIRAVKEKDFGLALQFVNFRP